MALIRRDYFFLVTQLDDFLEGTKFAYKIIRQVCGEGLCQIFGNV